MLARNLAWAVQPHGDLEQLDEDLWVVSAFSRRMTVVRLTGDRLLIYNAVALDDATLQVVEWLGTPAFLVVPNNHHREAALAWQQRYPRAELVDSAGPKLADPTITLMTVTGSSEREMALLVRRAAGTTLVINDIIAAEQQQLLEWAAIGDLSCIVVSSGELIESEPQRALRRLAHSLS